MNKKGASVPEEVAIISLILGFLITAWILSTDEEEGGKFIKLILFTPLFFGIVIFPVLIVWLVVHKLLE